VRGNCDFIQKVRNAQAAQAIGVVVRAANPRGPGSGDPLAPPRGPLGSFPERETAIGNAPALVPGPGPLAQL
jgi:hypothetical protein